MKSIISDKISSLAILVVLVSSLAACSGGSSETTVTTGKPVPTDTRTPTSAPSPTSTPAPKNTPAPTSIPIEKHDHQSVDDVSAQDTLFLASGEPNTLDPAKWLFSADDVIGDIFSGLVQLDTSLQVIPDLAERWEVSPDGTVYTFYLREGVTFHDGSPFTAEDVKFSWERAANPELESDTALTYLGDIVGVSEVNAGNESEISGLNIVDDYTLEITLDAPKSYFLSKLSYPVSWIVDSETVDEIETAPNGTGPFALESFDENEGIILVRNPNYYRADGSLEHIVYLIGAGSTLRLYEANRVHIIGISEDLLERANDSSDPLYGTVQTANSLCTSYITFDVSQPPFDDPLVRQAFGLAIDKDRFNNIILEGTGVLAQGLFPPGLPGYNPDVTSPGYNPAKARQALSESSYGSAAALPEIVITTGGAGTDVPPSVSLFLQMWQQELGVTPAVEQLDSDSYFDEIFAGNHGQILFGGWCADYPDPENFADILFHTGSRQNHGNYSNPDLDVLLEEARVERDIDTRLALYEQIEQIIIDDMPVVFLSHSSAFYIVTKPELQGYVSTPIGVAQSMNLSLERRAEASPQSLSVLLVVEDVLSGRPDFTSSDEMAESLNILDVDFDTWSTFDRGTPGRQTLSDYNVVIWAVGDDCCDSPPLESVGAMIDYLNDGGNLLIEGSSVASPWGGTIFTVDALGIMLTGFSPIGDIVIEDPDHPLAAGFPSDSIRLSVSGAVPPDAFDADLADAIFVRGPNSAEQGKAAITAYDSGQFRVVFSVVPLQWFSDADRERFLRNALEWLSS